MKKIKPFWRLTILLDGITYLLLAPMGFVGIFIAGDFFADRHRFIFGLISLFSAIILNTIFGLAFRWPFIYRDLENLYENELSYKEKQEIKINLLKYPLREALVMVPRWILGFPSTMLFAVIFMPITIKQTLWTAAMGTILAFLGFLSNYLNAENFLTDIFRETKLNEVEIDEKHYLNFELMYKLLGIIISFLICATFSFSFLSHIISIGYLKPEGYIIYNIILSIFLAYLFIGFSKVFISSIKKSLNEVESVIEEISNNNLMVANVRITSDEIGRINQNIATMAENLKQLIENISKTSANVDRQADKLADSSTQSKLSIEEVTDTIDNLLIGINVQGQNTESMLERLNNLARKIESVQENVGLAKINTQKTESLGRESIGAINKLQKNFNTTVAINEEIKQEVDQLKEQSDLIGNIVATINAIAGQTNLLALNASIDFAHSL